MDGLLVLLLLLAQTVGSLKLTPAGVDSGSLVCTTCVCTGGLVDVRGQQAGEPAYGVMGTYHLYDDGSDAPNGRPTFVLRDSFFLFFASADAGETGWAIGPVLQGQPYVLFARSDVASPSLVPRGGWALGKSALAYGTDRIRPVDVITGPGNAWVAEAKRHQEMP